MLGLTAATAVQVALMATGAGEYQKAFDRADEEGKPLLVLVGADWCAGCRVMKNDSIPTLRRTGGLKNIVYTEVDADAKPELSRKLLRGKSLPQLVLYTRAGKLWRRTQMTGSHTPSEVKTFLKREIAVGQKVATRTRRASYTNRRRASTSAVSY